MARILFTTFGSYGDIHPYMAIGIELQKRGHAVTIATSSSYAAKITSEGLGFHAVRPDISLDDQALLAYVMDARRGSERVLRYVGSDVRESYEDTLPAARQADLIVTHPIAFGGVMAAEKLGLPWISSVLAPISFLSAWDPPVPAPTPWIVKARALSPGLMRLIWQLAKYDTRRWIKPVLALRRELGLPDRGHPLFEGSHSPQLVLALFSRCLAEPQPDWPPKPWSPAFPSSTATTSRRKWRLHSTVSCPKVPLLSSSRWDPPRSARPAISTATACRPSRKWTCAPYCSPARIPRACRKLCLPGVMAVPYAAHSEVFPRASAIVHQGGIGTTAQAMRAGRPALVVPFAHDQFDNAERVRRLGVAEVVYRSRYNALTAEAALRRLGEPVTTPRPGSETRCARNTASSMPLTPSSAH